MLRFKFIHPFIQKENSHKGICCLILLTCQQIHAELQTHRVQEESGRAVHKWSWDNLVQTETGSVRKVLRVVKTTVHSHMLQMNYAWLRRHINLSMLLYIYFNFNLILLVYLFFLHPDYSIYHIQSSLTQSLSPYPFPFHPHIAWDGETHTHTHTHTRSRVSTTLLHHVSARLCFFSPTEARQGSSDN
jgi:hypothetical protein